MRDDSTGWVGKKVEDIYGRKLGRAVGLVFDLSGEVASIGVEEAGSFHEVDAERVVSDSDKIEVMPEWKADSRRTGMQGASLERRLQALAGMAETKGVSRESYDSLYAALMGVRATHGNLRSKILQRLEDLEREDKLIAYFLIRVELGFLAGETSEETYNLTTSECDAIKEANAKETADIRRTLGDPALREVADVALSKTMRVMPEEAGLGAARVQAQTGAKATAEAQQVAKPSSEREAESPKRRETSAPASPRKSTPGSAL